MKKCFLLICFAFYIVFTAESQTIKMKIASITPTAGETVQAYQSVNILPVSGSGTGSGVGTPTFEPIKIKKLVGMSSIELLKRSVLGITLPEVDFEFYDSSNTMFYKTAIKSVRVISMSYLSPECSSCSTLSQQIAFNFIQIELTDVATGTTIRCNPSLVKHTSKA